MTDAPAPALPRYRSHKIVGAAKIKMIVDDGLPGRRLVLDIGASVRVSDEFLARCPKLAVGGYYVRYPQPDGSEYDSFSPADVFDAGYTRLPEDMMPAAAPAPLPRVGVADLDTHAADQERVRRDFAALPRSIPLPPEPVSSPKVPSEWGLPVTTFVGESPSSPFIPDPPRAA